MESGCLSSVLASSRLNVYGAPCRLMIVSEEIGDGRERERERERERLKQVKDAILTQCAVVSMSELLVDV